MDYVFTITEEDGAFTVASAELEISEAADTLKEAVGKVEKAIDGDVLAAQMRGENEIVFSA